MGDCTRRNACKSYDFAILELFHRPRRSDAGEVNIVKVGTEQTEHVRTANTRSRQPFDYTQGKRQTGGFQAWWVGERARRVHVGAYRCGGLEPPPPFRNQSQPLRTDPKTARAQMSDTLAVASQENVPADAQSAYPLKSAACFSTLLLPDVNLGMV